MMPRQADLADSIGLVLNRVSRRRPGTLSRDVPSRSPQGLLKAQIALGARDTIIETGDQGIPNSTEGHYLIC
jgi:hypothetical protein